MASVRRAAQVTAALAPPVPPAPPASAVANIVLNTAAMPTVEVTGAQVATTMVTAISALQVTT